MRKLSPGAARRPRPASAVSRRAAALATALAALCMTPAGPARAAEEAAAPLRVEGLDPLAAGTLGTALEYLDLRPEELGFDKLYADDDTFRLDIVEEILDDPLRLPGWQQATLEQIRLAHESPSALARLLGGLVEASAPADRRGASRFALPASRRARAPATPPAASQPPARAASGRASGGPHETLGDSVAAPPDLDAALVAFEKACEGAEAALNRAFAKLTGEDRARVLMLAPAFWGDSDHPADRLRKGALHREAGAEVDTTLKWTEDPILDAAVKLDRAALTEAAALFLAAVERLETAAVAFAASEGVDPELPPGESDSSCTPATELPGVTGLIRKAVETPWGLLVVGGSGPNDYSAEAMERIAFVVEPGGSDVYRGRAASAVGGLTRTLSAVIDLGGDDLYEAGDAPDGTPRTYAVGGAVFGLAALCDRGGDDVYRADDGSLGAGFFGGGFLFDGGGRDLHEGRNLCEGSGAFGLGVLAAEAPDTAPIGPELEVDRAFDSGHVKVRGTGARPIRWDDNDTYVCARQSQGFASTFGLGLLYDRVGNDTYRSGGVTLHRPLLPHDFQSLAQGFSIGFRPRAAGGIGLLLDEEGNDFYDAEVYAQGTSYWYAIGLLADLGGNDRYLATQYAQGAGVHLSVGSIYDRGGDDHYVCKLGVTQGTAHDLSVGWQIDESGNDYYLVSDGQGMSITNSTAVFVDGQGDDVYATPGVGQGWLTWARGFCGAGIFLDLEGKDTYPAQSGAAEGYGRNGGVWSPDLYALGIDLDRDVILPSDVVPEPVLTAADSAMTVEQLFELSNIWEVGSAREKVRRARQALIERGMEAVRYSLEHGLDTQDGLVYRNLSEIGKAHPDSFAALILPRLRDPDVWVQRNVISLLGDLKRAEARAPLEAMLRDKKQERHHNRILQALGNIGDRAAIPAVRRFLADPKERRRIATVVALAALQDTASVGAFVGMLEDPALTVRSAAAAALGRFPVEAVAALTGPGAASSPATATPSFAEPLRVRTLGRLAVALRDSTRAPEVEARRLARRELMRVLEETGGWTAAAVRAKPRDPRTYRDFPASLAAPPPRARGLPDAAARAAAVEALLRLGETEMVDFVRLRMRDEADPLVRRTFERMMREQETSSNEAARPR